MTRPTSAAALLGDETTSANPAVRILAISGKGGVGKTTLALHVAHQLRNRYPDAQLYVDLRGIQPDPLDPGDTLLGFLQPRGGG